MMPPRVARSTPSGPCSRERGGGCHQRFGATQIEVPRLGALLYWREAEQEHGALTLGAAAAALDPEHAAAAAAPPGARLGWQPRARQRRRAGR